MLTRTPSWDAKTGLKFSALGKALYCSFGLRKIYLSGDPAEATTVAA
jgi:hypothetical protein